MNKVRKLGRSCCMKPVIASQAHMLRKMKMGLPLVNILTFPPPCVLGMDK